MSVLLGQGIMAARRPQPQHAAPRGSEERPACARPNKRACRLTLPPDCARRATQGDIFRLTQQGLRDGEGKIEIADPEGWGRVTDLKGQLMHVVNTLNEKVGGVLEKQEKDFLSAYRAHMFQVQKELQALRAKANEAELAMKKNEKIRSLEEERNWYRKEALRLDKFATAMKRDLKYMKEKLESIEDDRNWLERQLKGSKKSNKLLRAELEIRLMSEQEGGGMSSTMGAGGGPTSGDEGKAEFYSTHSGALPPARGASREGMLPPARGAETPTDGYDGRGGGAGGGGGRAGGRAGGSGRLGHSGSSGDFGGVGGSDDVRRMRAHIDKLETQLAAERRAVKALRAKAVSDSTQRADLERFFVRCIDDVKREVSRRRMKASSRGAHSRGAADDVGEPGLSDFTATDRRRVIRRLLSDDYVLQMLHSMVFGGDSAPPSAGDDGGVTGTLDDIAPALGDGGMGDRTPSMRSLTPRSDGGIALDPAVQDYLGMPAES